VDGGTLEDIDIRDITAKNTGNALFLRLGHRNQQGPIGELRRIYIGNVTAEIPAGKPDKGYEIAGPPSKFPHNIFPSSVTGMPGHPAQDITLENIDITYAGVANKDTAFFSADSLSKVPEQAAAYPEFSMFGELPASGLYARHVAGLHLKNIRIHYTGSDYRPSCIFDDLQGLSLDQIRIGLSNSPGVSAHPEMSGHPAMVDSLRMADPGRIPDAPSQPMQFPPSPG
jgi:hypothetical protein